jgi:hypothetical protein
MLCDPRTAQWRCEQCQATFAPEQLAETSLARESIAVSLFEKQEWFSSVTQLLAAAARAEKLVGPLHWSVAVQHRKVMRNILQLDATNKSAEQGLSASEFRDRILQKEAATSNCDEDDEYDAYVAAMNGEDVQSYATPPQRDDSGEDSDDGFDHDDEHLRLHNADDDDNDDNDDGENESDNDDVVPLSGDALLHRAADSGMIWVRWAMHCDARGELATTAATAMQELYVLLLRLNRREEAARVARHFVDFYASEWTAGGGADDSDDSDDSDKDLSERAISAAASHGDIFVAEARALVAEFFPEAVES